ncbi:MAG: hypothetical protein M3552_15070, partial [Planctomycetota bacterium]|nr:hypothetical protein [Planctomycetota bacterium]
RTARLFTADGVRGVYRNELTHADVERLVTAFAGGLWEEAAATGSGVPARGFPVVVGYDDRPWSVPVAVAAGEALRRTGCETIDVGLVTGPAFRFAVSHLDAAAGVLATGAGGGPAVAGLDFAGKAGRPLSTGGGLDRLKESFSGRMNRGGAGRREFDANIPYEASLWRHFQSSSIASCVVGTSSPLVHQRLERVAKEASISLTVVELPRRAVDATGIDTAGISRIAAAVARSGATFGMWLDEDGTRFRVLDERGRTLPVADVAGILIEDALTDRPGATVVVDWEIGDRLCETVLRRREVARCNGSAESMTISMADHAAAVGVDSAGRLWLPGQPLACDGLAALARVLRALAGTDTPL